ncbi:MAG: polysaccharide biosynthesis protein, partial [Magnetococcales bacterium]|nr:polysaccharide biosynthesis protein [Magnetococcales bacterium]
VAFSDGSLLHGFGQRLAKGQPLAAPTDVRRYFISAEEAGQMCLLAVFLGANRDIFVPRPVEGLSLKPLAEVAELFLRAHGFSPILCDSEAEARAIAAEPGFRERGGWPCCFTPSDTTGEKPYEEFVGATERVDYGRFAHVGVIAGEERLDPMPVRQALAAILRVRQGEAWSITALAAALSLAVPELTHRPLGRDLDRKM